MAGNLYISQDITRYMRTGNILVGLVQFCECIPEKNKKILVEIGSFQGESSEIFCQYFKEVYCVDTWNPAHFQGYVNHAKITENPEQVFDRIAGDKYQNCKKIKLTSEEAARSFEDGSIDVVYIDGDHSYDGVKQDILAWKQKVKFGGIISGHDYHIGSDVEKALLETLNKPDILFMDFSWMYINR